MSNLCPFFKENCHGNECVMWKNEKCLVVSYLEDVSLDEEDEIEGEAMEDESETSGARVPECLKDVTPEELAVEMMEYVKKEFPEESGRRGFYTVSRFFWESKGVSRFFISSPETQLKIDRANFLAEKEITKQEEEKKRQQLEKEKDQLPSLNSQCVDWARMKGLKRLALTDIDAFLFDKEITLLRETKRVLFSNANSKLKTG